MLEEGLTRTRGAAWEPGSSEHPRARQVAWVAVGPSAGAGTLSLHTGIVQRLLLQVPPARPQPSVVTRAAVTPIAKQLGLQRQLQGALLPWVAARRSGPEPRWKLQRAWWPGAGEAGLSPYLSPGLFPHLSPSLSPSLFSPVPPACPPACPQLCPGLSSPVPQPVPWPFPRPVPQPVPRPVPSPWPRWPGTPGADHVQLAMQCRGRSKNKPVGLMC